MLLVPDTETILFIEPFFPAALPITAAGGESQAGCAGSVWKGQEMPGQQQPAMGAAQSGAEGSLPST